jgi:hypothetical protein
MLNILSLPVVALAAAQALAAAAAGVAFGRRRDMPSRRALL